MLGAALWSGKARSLPDAAPVGRQKRALQFLRALAGPGAIKKYGRTKNNASTAETSRSISAFASRRKYPNGWEQGRRPKRRKEIGNDPGGTAVRRRAG